MEPAEIGPYVGFLPFAGMLAVVAINLGVTRRRTQMSLERDGGRLRAALGAELGLLREIAAENLRLARNGRDYLLSARQMTGVYRGNVGRLNLLEEHEIDAVVTAYGRVEAAETLIAATTRAQGLQSYRVLHGETPATALGERLVACLEAIDGALGHLAGTPRPGRPADARPTPLPSLATPYGAEP